MLGQEQITWGCSCAQCRGCSFHASTTSRPFPFYLLWPSGLAWGHAGVGSPSFSAPRAPWERHITGRLLFWPSAPSTVAPLFFLLLPREGKNGPSTTPSSCSLPSSLPTCRSFLHPHPAPVPTFDLGFWFWACLAAEARYQSLPFQWSNLLSCLVASASSCRCSVHNCPRVLLPSLFSLVFQVTSLVFHSHFLDSPSFLSSVVDTVFLYHFLSHLVLFYFPFASLFLPAAFDGHTRRRPAARDDLGIYPPVRFCPRLA